VVTEESSSSKKINFIKRNENETMSNYGSSRVEADTSGILLPPLLHDVLLTAQSSAPQPLTFSSRRLLVTVKMNVPFFRTIDSPG
jgi:hypothetical protein